MHDLLFECDIAVINVLGELHDRLVHGFLGAEDGAGGSHMLMGMFVKGRQLRRGLSRLSEATGEGWCSSIVSILMIVGFADLNFGHNCLFWYYF